MSNVKLTRIDDTNLHEIFWTEHFVLYDYPQKNNEVHGNTLDIAQLLQGIYNTKINFSLNVDDDIVNLHIDDSVRAMNISDFNLNSLCKEIISYAVSKYKITLFVESLLEHERHRALFMAANFRALSNSLRDAATLNKVEDIQAVIEDCLSRVEDD